MSDLEFKEGDLVKVRFEEGIQDAGGERIWVLVEKVSDDGVCVGRLDNNPVVYPGKVGDRVGFTKSQVISVWRD